VEEEPPPFTLITGMGNIICRIILSLVQLVMGVSKQLLKVREQLMQKMPVIPGITNSLRIEDASLKAPCQHSLAFKIIFK
jgi:uncharacterized membrane protein